MTCIQKQILWKHRDLVIDLAQAKETNFIEVPLGSVWLTDYQIADVIKIRPSYTRFCVDIFEVKCHRSDFLADLRREKWRGYLDCCHRFYFACLVGIFQKEELPPEVGLYVRGENGWKCIKVAQKREVEIPSIMLMAMLFYKQKCINEKRRYYRKQFAVNYGRIPPKDYH